MQRKCQTFLGERLVPAEHFIGLPAPRQSVGQADVLAGPRDPPPYLARGTAGTRAIQPPTQKEAHLGYLPGKVEARDETKPASAYSSRGSPRWGPGRKLSGDSRKVSPSRAWPKPPGGRATRRADPRPRAREARSGQGASPEGPRAHSPRGRSCPLFPRAPRLAGVRRPARGRQPSTRSRETMRVTARPAGTRARGAPRLPSPSAFSSFAPFVCPNPSL